MIPAEKKDLVAQHDFLCEDVRQDFDPVLPSVHVVSEEQEGARSQMDAQRPHRVRKSKKIRHISVKIAKNIGRGF